MDLATAAERGSELTSQMLAYAGRSTPETRPRDISEIAAETARLLASSISKKAHLTLELELSVWVPVDAGQLHQVVMNLVTNASDALGDEEGTIQVRTGIGETAPDPDANQRAYLEVIDDGAGMDEQTVRDMFDPFFATKFSGRGLGLAAVHGIVRSHGGTISVDSEPGRGSRIRVLLPTCSAPLAEGSQAATQTGDRAVPARSATLLVVDDEAQVRNVTRMALEHRGYSVIEASDGHEALALIGQHPSIDGVVLDLTMPRLSGGETLEVLRVGHPNLPVLLVSGYEAVPGTTLDPAGPSDFLQKPFRPDEIAGKVADLLQNQPSSPRGGS
ncbi:MAG: response regulator [bacterium]|nr:response regulator [bacterium]